MKTGLCGRADLVRALDTGGPGMMSLVADMLGYKATAPRQAPEVSPAVTGVASQAATVTAAAPSEAPGRELPEPGLAPSDEGAIGSP